MGRGSLLSINDYEIPFCSCSVVQCIECGSRFDPFCSIPSIYKQEKFAWVKSPCSWSLLWFCLLLLLPHPSKTTTITLLSFIPTTYIWFGVSVIQAIQSSYIYPQLLVQWLVFCLCNYSSTSDRQTKRLWSGVDSWIFHHSYKHGHSTSRLVFSHCLSGITWQVSKLGHNQYAVCSNK